MSVTYISNTYMLFAVRYICTDLFGIHDMYEILYIFHLSNKAERRKNQEQCSYSTTRTRKRKRNEIVVVLSASLYNLLPARMGRQRPHRSDLCRVGHAHFYLSESADRVLSKLQYTFVISR